MGQMNSKDDSLTHRHDLLAEARMLEGYTERVSIDENTPAVQILPPPELGNNGSNMMEEQAAQAPIGGNTHISEMRQTFALVIGINKYEGSPNDNLQGAVADAENFRGYLLQERNVPEANITYLRDGEATRLAIIENFRKLERDEKIIPGEAAIIIYFAGHGAVAHKPATWTNWETPNGEIEILCPADINREYEDRSVTPPVQKKIEGIPDRTISRLLLDISKAKGNNITLILDCCHAAGMNRGGDGSELRARGFQVTQDLSPTCDEDIYSSTMSEQDHDISLGFSNSYFRSHVLLAACGRNQAAREQATGGIFTKALLGVLKKFPPGVPQPTYSSLIGELLTGIPKDIQTPQVDGKYFRRHLFDSWQEPASSLILCRKRDTKHDLILHAGLLHGIEKDSTFEIFASDSPNSKLLATSTVTKVEDAVSHLTPSDSDIFNLNTARSLCYARLRKASGPPLKTHCNDPGVRDRIQVLANSNESKLTARVILVESPDNADLCLKVDAKAIRFDRGKDASAFVSIFPRYSSCPVHSWTDIQDFINRYAHFTSHITRRSTLSIEDFVRIEMNKVKWNNYDELFEPDGEVALKKVDNGDLYEVIMDTSLGWKDRDFYGFTIYNKGDDSLYVNVLYFDASESVIDILYSSRKSQTGDSADPCLVRGTNSKLTLGHGSSPMRPLVFDVPDGQDEDVCFIKIFVSTKAVDIGPIEQPKFPPADGQSRNAMTLPDGFFESSSLKWASKMITVVSKRIKNGISQEKENESHKPEGPEP